MSLWGFDGKKGQTKKYDRSFFSLLVFFAAANFLKRGARAKQVLDTVVITHSLSYLRIGTSLSKRRVSKATESMSLPLLWTNAKDLQEASAIKDDKPGIPMIGSQVALAFHWVYHRPQNCFSVCARGKIQNFFWFCEK